VIELILGRLPCLPPRALDDEALEQVQELQLTAGEVRVLPDEPIEGFADRIRCPADLSPSPR